MKTLIIRFIIICVIVSLVDSACQCQVKELGRIEDKIQSFYSGNFTDLLDESIVSFGVSKDSLGQILANNPSYLKTTVPTVRCWRSIKDLDIECSVDSIEFRIAVKSTSDPLQNMIIIDDSLLRNLLFEAEGTRRAVARYYLRKNDFARYLYWQANISSNRPQEVDLLDFLNPPSDNTYFKIKRKIEKIEIEWLENGHTTLELTETEIEELIILAHKGNTSVCYDLGWIYQKGFGVAPSIEKAIYWYEKIYIFQPRVVILNLIDLYNQHEGEASVQRLLNYLLEEASRIGLRDRFLASEIGGSLELGLNGFYIDLCEASCWYLIADDLGLRSSGIRLNVIRSMVDCNSDVCNYSLKGYLKE